MLDVQKAFDSVNHRLLCEKIRLAGIEPDWFQSYLANRKQTVFVNGTFSSEQEIKCGVPQGSILGPWCYLLYSNDMPSCVNHSTIILYADDTILLSSSKDLNDVAQTLGNDMTNCSQWLSNNGLAMHKGKTEALILTSKRKKHKVQNFTINHEGHTVIPSNTVKYLGLPINSTLSGEEIVTSIISKTTNRLKFLYRQREHLNAKTRKMLAQALILSHFDYAIGAWYPSLIKKHKKALQVAQNKIVRFVLELGPRAHIGQQELDKMGILSVEDRSAQLILHTMYDVFNNTAPVYLCNDFVCNRTRYNTRHSNNSFQIPRTKGISKNNFSTFGAQLWNNLPNNIKTIPTKASFKKAIKVYLKQEAHSKENSEFIYY